MGDLIRERHDLQTLVKRRRDFTGSWLRISMITSVGNVAIVGYSQSFLELLWLFLFSLRKNCPTPNLVNVTVRRFNCQNFLLKLYYSVSIKILKKIKIYTDWKKVVEIVQKYKLCKISGTEPVCFIYFLYWNHILFLF